MTDETMPATAPAEQHTQPAQQTPATHHEEHYQEQPAHEAPADYEEQFTEDNEEPADLGEILDDRPKKHSGAQRAKLQRQYFESQLQERDSHIAERDSHIAERDRRIQELEAYVSQDDEARRRADTRRKHEAAHNERVSGAKETSADWDQVMAKMRDVAIHDDVIDEIVASDKSPLLAYHLANNPDKIRELNSMNGREMAREIVRLEGTLSMPSGKKQTSAPPPPSRLSGGAAPHVALEQENDMGNFAKRLIKTLDARKRR